MRIKWGYSISETRAIVRGCVLLIISIFKSGSRGIIAVRVASAQSALATLASAKRGWLTEYEVGSGVWRS